MAEDKDKTPKGDINFEYNQGISGLNMDNIPSQIDKGQLSYALNASLENFDSNSVTYQNEPGNEFCLEFPHNYILIGKYLIPEQNKQIFFLANPTTGDSEIGYMVNNDCVYHTFINAKCLNFDINYPIHKIVHKTSNCGTEIYWAQPNADRRYLNLDPEKIPYIPFPGSTPCNENLTNQLDCNQLRVQSNYSIPYLEVVDVISGGNLISGTYQFAVQYSDALGNPLSSYHSITNPTPIADPFITTVNFNYPVGKSIVLDVSNIEISGQFEYFNIVVIKTINAITSVELIGTYNIEGTDRQITYTGQNVTNIRLTVNDVFEKFPFYGPADDVTAVQDILVWKGLSAPERINYQHIANKITLQWETWRIPPGEDYSDELNATNLRGYLRDEVYPLEIVFLLTSGKQTDGFHIPGRELSLNEQLQPDVPPTDNDFIEDPTLGPQPYWRIYNTASVTNFSPGYSPDISYKGPYQYGEFAYWESLETYPCDEQIWGELASKPIRHHKFPDVAVSPIIESKGFTSVSDLQMGDDAIFPIGIKVDINQIKGLISSSSLTPEQKADIVGFKIVRGDRTDNKSIVAKGILRNVGKYTRDEQDFYYPNYPYNDLTEDPFLLAENNALTDVCEPYNINILDFNQPTITPTFTQIKYNDCVGEELTITYPILGTQPLLRSINKPTLVGTGTINNMQQTAGGPVPLSGNIATISAANYDVYKISHTRTFPSPWKAKWTDIYKGVITNFNVGVNNVFLIHVKRDTVPVATDAPFFSKIELIEQVRTELPLTPIEDVPELAYRQIFNSPETSFGQPFLGDILKLESVMFGRGVAHFVEVKDNAKYRLLSLEAQQDAYGKAEGKAGGDISAFFSLYQSYLTITINSITRQNFAYSFNSRADYNYTVPVPNDQQIKQRRIDLKRYLIPVIQNVGEEVTINNYQRETSVYLKTDEDYTALPFPHLSPNMIPLGVIDKSRYTVSERDLCTSPGKEENISVVSYYASLKNTFRSQWGLIYSYQTIDTGFQVNLYSSNSQPTTVFGGDTFICRFAFKTKVPFFIDNRVGAPDDSDIFYDELGNIAYPKYWHSARSITLDASTVNLGVLPNFFSYKAHNFDCPNSQDVPKNNPNRNYYDGIFYLFAYGIPNFYVESSYNVDLRQAFNNKEGDFWPHVTNSIPDDWVQESFVSIANDNTYNYNVTYSKQNKENLFTHIPPDTEFKPCEFIYPFRAIFSDPQVSTADTNVNNWLIYRASSYFDFPQNYGALTSLDGIENRKVLARFENKTMLYNALYTTQTNTGGQVYLGQPLFSADQSIPLDFAETDLGYNGSQHKFLLKIPNGQISVDAKRGQIFLISGNDLKDLSAPGSGMNRFFTDHLAFEILRYFPNLYIDNHFNGIGLHGVYDSKFNRVIITKLDYIPLSSNIKYDEVTKEFYKERIVGDIILKDPVFLTDKTAFCNKSWTLSYSLTAGNWISFHSYLPNWYIGENNFFYSGNKNCCSEFDFEFLSGELVPNPPTTTTTSSSTTSTSSTTTTTTTLSCSLVGGTVVAMNCDLAGTAVVTVPPTTTSTSSTSSTSSTTTTTTTCSMYIYSVWFYSCGTCTFVVEGTIGNSEPLTIAKWYYDTITNSKVLIRTFEGCSGGSDRFILDSNQEDTCPAVACPTTTTTTTV